MYKNRKFLLFLVVFCCFLPQFTLKSQSFFNDFEEQTDDDFWNNIRRKFDSLAFSGNFVSECPSDEEFPLEFNYPVEKKFSRHNLLLKVDMMLKAENKINTVLVVTVNNNNNVSVWQSFPINNNYSDSLNWFKFHQEISLPYDCLENANMKCYLWNKSHDYFIIDDVYITINTNDLPKYLPETSSILPQNLDLYKTDSQIFNILFSNNGGKIAFADGKCQLITKSISMVYSLVRHKDSIDIQNDRWEFVGKDENCKIFQFKNRNRYAETLMILTVNESSVNCKLITNLNFKGKLLRATLVVPFFNNDFTVYRQNMNIDTVDYQDVYYLEKEGFSNNINGMSYSVYHPDNLSSMQLNTVDGSAFFNIDFYLDHPMIYYPLVKDNSDYYIDISARKVNNKTLLNADFDLFITESKTLPRIMPVPFGYESAIIWTEHADWTNIRTQRATYFGSEDIIDADSATGGYVFYNIPVTKSVFYNNPDSVKNDEKNPEFAGLHSTIKTDTAFFDFLKQLKTKGFDICLHTPEQYTTNRGNLAEALSFMKQNFGSPSWIDHGYNNSLIHNRENMVCDGFDKKSPYYAADLWRDNGVKYLWNATYEETRPFDKYQFDCNLHHPYLGFGDAFPLPRIISLPDEPDFLLWSTSYTTEPGEEWNYFFSQDRLDKIAKYHSIFITHCYSPWVTTDRGFWDMEDGKVIAKESFNSALKRIADMKEQHLILPTTVAKQMKYLEQLQYVKYSIDGNGNVILENNNPDVIEGFSIITSHPIDIEGVKSESRQAEKEWIIWFDFEAGGKIKIE